MNLHPVGDERIPTKGLLVAKARFSTILRHTNIATNKVAGLG
jgi:hypothetical protein